MISKAMGSKHIVWITDGTKHENLLTELDHVYDKLDQVTLKLWILEKKMGNLQALFKGISMSYTDKLDYLIKDIHNKENTLKLI